MTAIFIAVVYSVSQMGCRGTWGPSSKLRSEPSFDQLLELESSSVRRSPESNPTGPIKFSDQTSVHPQVAQRRPGSRSANSRHSDLSQVDHRASNSPSSEDEEISMNDTRVVRRRISDDDDSTGSLVYHASDEKEWDDSDEHAGMLQKTQVALKNRYRPESQPVLSSNEPRASDKQMSLAVVANEEGIQRRSPEMSPQEGSAPEVVAASHREPHAGDAAAVQSAVHNRYREVQGAEEIELATHISSNAATGSTGELGWQKHLELAMQQLSKSTSTTDASSPLSREQIRQSIISRLLAMSLGDREQMSASIDGLQPEEQEYLKYQLTALMDAIDPDANPVSSRRWSLVMLNQRKAHELLASMSNLEVGNVCFCTQVESFGVVERFPKYQFTPDQEVLLYCEIDNFVSERSKDGKGFETQLQGTYEIVDSTGRRIADQTLPMDTHVCRNRRRDYFIAYRVYMPQNISPGSYALRLTIEDMKGRKFGQSEVAFQIQ